jgi:phage protein D
MLKATYKLTVAGWSVDSASDARTELVELDVLQTINVPSDYCRITAYAPPSAKPGALEQLAGAAASAVGLAGGGGAASSGFSVDVRGQKVAPADAMTIELTADDVTDTVMTAEVQSVESSFGEITLTGRTGMQKLATTRVNQVYEKQTLKQIVSDLAQQAGVQVGTVDDGSTYQYLVVHESKSVLRVINELARREAMDVFVDSDNKLTVTTFSKTAADHTFRYGAEILGLALDTGDPTADHVRVHGESPSSSSGSDTWHWLVKDLSSFRGDSGQGVRARGMQDGAVRTKDLAGSAAAAHLGAIRDAAKVGRVKILGNPKVKRGEAIEIRDAPRPELNGLFKVTSVRHLFSKHEGYVTVVEFSGQGGAAAAASDLLGQVGSLVSL